MDKDVSDKGKFKDKRDRNFDTQKDSTLHKIKVYDFQWGYTNILSSNLRRCKKRSTEIHSRRIKYISLKKKIEKSLDIDDLDHITNNNK